MVPQATRAFLAVKDAAQGAVAYYARNPKRLSLFHSRRKQTLTQPLNRITNRSRACVAEGGEWLTALLGRVRSKENPPIILPNIPFIIDFSQSGKRLLRVSEGGVYGDNGIWRNKTSLG